MTVLAVVLAGLAAALLVGAPPGRGWEERLVAAPVVEVRGGPPRLRPVWPVGGVLVVAACWVVLGRPAGVVAACLLLLAGTVALVVGEHGRRRGSETTRAEVARACAVLAGELRIGKVPGEALLTASEDCPVLAPTAAVHRGGGDVVPVLRALADQPGADGLGPVADAWQVATRTGAPLTRSLDRVSSALKAGRAVHRVVDAELAAPRATGRMLAVLPLAGLALGLAIGGDPLGFLLGTTQGQLCLLLGVLLACAGVLWSERLAR
ncbi:type II secretion system F family protein [Auraticoccus monumenti]|uniref:Tight adherence protein B n=1 Tax=Auraticoccus monumenti TaxID=675864 RepID=A0A1G6S0G0_9ACTN|nr:hypothetical protein [Auraticoccus monumenti]SDD10318.1 tight adherence protein B [Auraticoccus monumenti]